MEGSIPIVDFKKCLRTNLSKDEAIEVGNELAKAFSTVGFAYLANTGISKKLIEDAREASKFFFLSESSKKSKFARDPDTNHGYVGVGVESVNPERPGDYKEAFNICGWNLDSSDVEWPSSASPNFHAALKSLMEESRRLIFVVLHVLGIGMGLEDENFFVNCHQGIHTNNNQTTCRTLYYLPLSVPAKPGQIRLGEHSDYGSLTLLYQDDVGGLEVQNMDGKYVDATPIEDTVLVNIGDLLQFWTRGKMKSTKHRVLIPEEEIKKKLVRQSIVYFVYPDDDVPIAPLVYKDKENNEARISGKDEKHLTALEHLKLRLSKTY